MPLADPTDFKLIGASLLILASALAATAAGFGLRAADHMAMAAELCGPGGTHCLSCGLSASAALAAAAAALAASRAFQAATGRGRVSGYV